MELNSSEALAITILLDLLLLVCDSFEPIICLYLEDGRDEKWNLQLKHLPNILTFSNMALGILIIFLMLKDNS